MVSKNSNKKASDYYVQGFREVFRELLKQQGLFMGKF